MAKCEQITTIDKTMIVRRAFVGKVSGKKMNEIEKAVMIAIGII